MRPSLTFLCQGALLSLALAGCTGSIGDPADSQLAGAGGAGSSGTVLAGGYAGTSGGATAGSGNSMPSAGSSSAGSGGALGVNSGGAGSGAGMAPTPCTGSQGLTTRRVRRLALREYVNVVADLIGDRAAAEAKTKLGSEPRVGGFDNQDDYLFVSPSLMENISDLAASLASEADPAKIAACATSSGSPACLESFIRSFSEKAYGRPLTDEEFARAKTVAATGQDYATSVRLVIELVLQSPNMLYVTELGPATQPVTSGQPVRLTSYEMASQLSFLLTGRRPDPTLLQAVEKSNFETPSDVLRETERMLSSDLAKAELKRFIDGWLDMAPISEAPKVPDVFPDFTPAVVAAMQQEYDQFITTQLKGGEGKLSDFMTATSTNIPSALAPIYGSDLSGGVLNQQHRRGVLSLPGLLTFHSADYHSGPVERGLLVRRQLLCQYIPGPPASVLDIIAKNPVDTADATKTTRQKFEVHVNEDSCRVCHSSFDPIGFGLEQMDGLGRFRTMENGLPVDSSGELTGADVGGKFEGPAQLSTLLSQSKLLESCMVEHFFKFAQARPPTTEDACVVQNWANDFAHSGGTIKNLVLSYVVHPNFANRKEDR